MDTRECISTWQEKQSVSVTIDGSTTAPEVHSRVVEASAAAASTSAPSVNCTHEVYLWLAKLNLQKYFDRFMSEGYVYSHFTYVTLVIHKYVYYRVHRDYRFDAVDIIEYLDQDEIFDIPGIKKVDALKIWKAI